MYKRREFHCHTASELRELQGTQEVYDEFAFII